MHACLASNHDILKLLIKKGADCSSRDQWGKTVLMYATGKGDLEMIKTLVDAGANVVAVDNVFP